MGPSESSNRTGRFPSSTISTNKGLGLAKFTAPLFDMGPSLTGQPLITLHSQFVCIASNLYLLSFWPPLRPAPLF